MYRAIAQRGYNQSRVWNWSRSLFQVRLLVTWLSYWRVQRLRGVRESTQLRKLVHFLPDTVCACGLRNSLPRTSFSEHSKSSQPTIIQDLKIIWSETYLHDDFCLPTVSTVGRQIKRYYRLRRSHGVPWGTIIRLLSYSFRMKSLVLVNRDQKIRFRVDSLDWRL